MKIRDLISLLEGAEFRMGKDAEVFYNCLTDGNYPANTVEIWEDYVVIGSAEDPLLKLRYLHVDE